MLDSSLARAFEGLGVLARQLSGAPRSGIWLVEARASGAATLVGHLAARVVDDGALLVVPDTVTDARCRDVARADEERDVRFFAGAPLRTREGAALGVLYVTDRVPRELTPAQRESLELLTQQAVAQLELQRHARALRESEARLRIATENARVGLVVLDGERRYVYANGTYAEILGLPSADLVGVRVRDALPALYDAQIGPRLDRAFAGERVTYELRRPSAGGDRFYTVRYEPTAGAGGVGAVVVVITETTEQRQAASAARQLAAIVESSSDAILGKDLAGTITSWNGGAEALFGYTAAEAIGTSIRRLIPPERQPEEDLILERLRRNEVVEHFETQRLTKDGRRIDVSITASPIRDQTGAVVGASKVARNISERKQADASLRAQQALLTAERDRAQRYLDTAEVILLALDTRGQVTLINRKGCEVLGWSEAELLGRDWIATCVPERARPSTLESFERVLAGDVAVVERPVLTRAGVERMIEWRTRVLRDDAGRVAGTIASGADITERQQATEALRSAEERTRFALQSADVGIWDMDYVTGALRWSETLEAQYGYAPGTFVGTFDGFMDRIHPEDRPSVRETLEQAIRTGADFTVQNRALWPDGTVRWLSGAGRIILDERGRAVRGLGVSMDVTERRVLEEQVHQAQKVEAIGRLTGGVAHDFNNVLSIVFAHADFLLEELDASDQRRLDVEEIKAAAERAAGLTRQLLAFSRKQVLAPRALDLNGVIEGMARMLRRLIGEDVELRTELAPDLGVVRADGGQIEQVVMNLVVNARDAMPTGGAVTLRTANVDIDARYAASHVPITAGSYVMLSVSDTGVGMSAEVQRHLFEPFFTTKGPGKGTGLGLPTSHGIVKQSGGHIWVYSEPGHGTVFRVYLPRVDACEASGAAPRNERGGQGAETVLLIDDDDGVRAAAHSALERKGYRVLVARGGDEALALAAQHSGRIDLILSDVVMPGPSGPELIERLRVMCPGAAVLLMSGFTEHSVVEQAFREGANHLQKPFTPASVAARVREVLDEHARAR